MKKKQKNLSKNIMGVKMSEETQKLVAILLEKIEKLESELFVKDYEIQNLKSENARLNELLTPTKTVGEN